MSEQIVRRRGALPDAQVALPWIAMTAVYVLLVVLGSRLLADPDTYSHIALGRWILEHHAVPTTDPFSQTMRGHPWVAFEWLSEICFALAYALGGWPAVAALAAAAAALAFWLLARFLLRDWPAVPALIALLSALVLASPHILARPHILALPLMVAWVAALMRALDDGRVPPWAMLPLMIVWANLHGSFTFGLAMTGAAACEALWNAAAAERPRVLRQWALFAGLALAAACINPYGPEMILVTFRTIALGPVLSTITEWRPQDFSHLGSFEIIMLAGFAGALYCGVKLPLMRLLMLLGVLHLALSQSRHAELLGLLGPLFIARPLADQFGFANAARALVGVRSMTFAAAIATAIAGGLAMVRTDVAPAANITPAKALSAFNAATQGPVLSDYNFGGYLDFAGIAPFIDGRGELYPREFSLQYRRAITLDDLPGFLRLLDQYKFGATLLAPDTPAVALLDRLPDWQRVYGDDVAVVHVRRSGAAPRH